MIYSLSGKLLMTDASSAAIECSGVGYRFTAPVSTLAALPQVGSNAFVYTYMNVKQDGIDLYGFADTAELDMFKLLISVSNVGPKLAISVLSTFKVDDICLYIANGDSKALSKASGVGLKSAQRIVLELKDKVSAGSAAFSRDNSSDNGMSTDGSAAKDAIAALVQFGYTQGEAAAAVGKCKNLEHTEDIIKQALRLLATQL